MLLVTKLIHRARMEDRVIISWSEHDYKFICDALSTQPHARITRRDSTEVTTIKRRFRNAIFSARRWFKQRYPSVEKRSNALAFMMQITGYRVPAKHGPKVIGKALREIREQLANGCEYSALSDAARRGWRTIVKHNAHDLKGMQHVLVELSRALKKD
jgi:hypothetical protein